MNYSSGMSTMSGTSPTGRHLIKEVRTDQAVQQPASSKPSELRLTHILDSGTRGTKRAECSPLRRPLQVLASISVTTVSMVTYPSDLTSGRQNRLGSYWKRPWCTEAIEESISWHATIRPKSGKGVLIVCVTSRDRSRSSIQRFAYLLTSRLNKSWSRNPCPMWQPMEIHPLSVSFARECFCSHPCAPELFLDSVIGGLSSTIPYSSPTIMLEDGWMWKLIISSQNSTEISSTSGWIQFKKRRTCFQLHYVLNPSHQHLDALQSWLTRRLSLHDRMLSQHAALRRLGEHR
nr:hypothetical protein [Sclerophthora macrospora virus A]